MNSIEKFQALPDCIEELATSGELGEMSAFAAIAAGALREVTEHLPFQSEEEAGRVVRAIVGWVVGAIVSDEIGAIVVDPADPDTIVAGWYHRDADGRWVVDPVTGTQV